MALYKDGPIEVGLDSYGIQELKTVLGATEEQIQANGYETYFRCGYYDIDCEPIEDPFDGPTLVDPHPFAMPVFWLIMSKTTWESPAVLFRYSSIGRLTQLDIVRNRTALTIIPHKFRFYREAGDLIRTLSDVEDVAKMVEPIKIKKGVPNLSQINVDVTKDQENPFEKDTYHVHFIGETPYWEKNAIQTDLVKLDIHANNMKEFLSQLQKAELSYVNEQSKHWEEEHTVETKAGNPNIIPYEEFIKWNGSKDKEPTTTEIDFIHKDNDLPFQEYEDMNNDKGR